MPDFQEIDPHAARQRIDAADCTVVDIRDPQSFACGRIPGAVRLHNGNSQDFLRDATRERPLIVCCYHGISSRMAAGWLAGQGFADVYSLTGGFEAWAGLFPDCQERDPS